MPRALRYTWRIRASSRSRHSTDFLPTGIRSLAANAEAGKVPGMEASTGALGHGLRSVSDGAGRPHQKRESRVFVIMGDGEIDEGSVWEAAHVAGKHRLTNLTAIIDYNKIQSAGPTLGNSESDLCWTNGARLGLQ